MENSDSITHKTVSHQTLSTYTYYYMTTQKHPFTIKCQISKRHYFLTPETQSNICIDYFADGRTTFTAFAFNSSARPRLSIRSDPHHHCRRRLGGDKLASKRHAVCCHDRFRILTRMHTRTPFHLYKFIYVYMLNVTF